MRFEEKFRIADEIAAMLLQMRREKAKEPDPFLRRLLSIGEETLQYWFGYETYAALCRFAEDGTHDAREYENALATLRPYQDAYLAQQAAFDMAKEHLAEKIDALVHSYGFSGNFPDYTCHDGRNTHTLRFGAEFTSDGPMDDACVALTAMDASGKSGKGDPERILPSSLRRSERLARQTAPFQEDGTLSDVWMQSLLRYADVAARRALMRHVSVSEKMRYLPHKHEETVSWLIFSVFSGMFYGLLFPLAFLSTGISALEYCLYALLSGSLFGCLLFAIMFFISRR